ncbi:MAG: carbohydrate kinase [Propionibacteriaceae bacterium]|jgi:fructokinase|nr:carbohydrate kinase [Propionibacteriaceae bacterium]
MKKVLVCGETLIDLLPQGSGSPEESLWRGRSAGGPLNSAVALARLGRSVGLVTRLGADAFAAQLGAFIVEQGIDATAVVHSNDATPLAIVSLDDEGKASYVFHFTGTAAFGWKPDELPEPDPGTWLHLASLGWVVEPGATVLREWLSRTASQWGGLSYDINVRPHVIPDPSAYWRLVRPIVETVGRAGGVIKASDDDLAFLAPAIASTIPGTLPYDEQDPSAAARTIAEHWARAHNTTVVVTLGADGSLAATSESTIFCPPVAVNVVDTVGAGDAFMAGFLDSHLAGGSLEVALHHGAIIAGLTCQQVGANPPAAETVDDHLGNTQCSRC